MEFEIGLDYITKFYINKNNDQDPMTIKKLLISEF